jgi:hypothetical protein
MATPAQLSEFSEWHACLVSLGQLIASQAVPDRLLLKFLETAVPATVSLLARWSHATSSTIAPSQDDGIYQVRECRYHACALHVACRILPWLRTMMKFCCMHLTAKIQQRSNRIE